MLNELAIFRHFYNLSRDAALDLPVWEYENLLENYQRIEAEKRLYNIYTTSSGFNGGESATELVQGLQRTISFESVEKDLEMSTPDKLPFNIPAL